MPPTASVASSRRWLEVLFDQNLSYRLCRRLADLFAGSEQAVRAGLAEADDISI